MRDEVRAKQERLELTKQQISEICYNRFIADAARLRTEIISTTHSLRQATKGMKR